MKLSDLIELDKQLEEQSEINRGLVEEQVNYLRNLEKKNHEITTWYRKKNYLFAHSIVEWKSELGPILHMIGNHVFIWTAKKGIIEFNIHTGEEFSSSLFNVIKNGGFFNAIQGLSFAEESLKRYLIDLEDENTHMKKQLETVKN